MSAIDDVLIASLLDEFEKLPGCRDPFFTRLWSDRRLKCVDDHFELDQIDELNARLVCSTLDAKQQLLLGLPDARAIRRSAILATALVKTFVEANGARRDAGSVLYFGSRIGIRTQLARAYVGGDGLSSYFQSSCQKGSFTGRASFQGQLPQLICVYSPIDPVAMVDTLNPTWVAIDCDEAVALPWVHDLVAHLARRRIPAVAWSSNPLSYVRRDFASNGTASFIWPLRMLCDLASDSNATSECAPILRGELSSREIMPCQITGAEVESFAMYLRDAERALAQGMSVTDGRLTRDSVFVAYRLLRALERLCVPLADFEIESDHYWGVSSIADLTRGMNRFIKATRGMPIAGALENARVRIEQAIGWLREHQPPLWNALIDLCIEDISDNIDRLFVFGGESHAEMFVNAMAAHERTPREVLAQMHIYPVSMSRLVRRLTGRELDSDRNGSLPTGDRPRRATLIGIPSDYAYRTLGSLLTIERLEILHYPHQATRLEKLVELLDAALVPSRDEWFSTLRLLAGRPRGAIIQRPRARSFELAKTRTIQDRPRPNTSFCDSDPLWEPGTPEDAIRYLFAGDVGSEETLYEPLALTDADVDRDRDHESTHVTVDNAIQIEFLGGWRGIFARQQRLNFIAADGSLSNRAASSARSGERVLYVIGHRRQSLYELVVSRVYDDPEIQIHLNFIQRWQEEARAQFREWIRDGKTVGQLFAEMKRRGSSLQSSLAVRWWCDGLTLRPRDREDLRRLAEILDMPFTRQCYQQIHRGGDRIHGLHIQLSLRLRNWLKRGATATEMRNELIDERTGLTLGDIQDALLPLTVHRVEEIEGPFYYAHLGQIERTDSDA
nr:hypothetical protein 3 [Pseudomonadaceae bacterium]